MSVMTPVSRFAVVYWHVLAIVGWLVFALHSALFCFGWSRNVPLSVGMIIGSAVWMCVAARRAGVLSRRRAQEGDS